MIVALVVGARPNYMKVAPLYHAMKKHGRFNPLIVHTGQHYDFNMSEVFFKEFELPMPDFWLGVGSGSHAEQTAKAMMAFEKVCIDTTPLWVIVVGDVNSTLAASLVAAKLGIKLAHVEAGLRSYDRTMPEEINRLVTDALSDLLFTPSIDANENLKKEGIDSSRIFFVGNIMIDTFENERPKISRSDILLRLGKRHAEYFVLTIHRLSNLNNPELLKHFFSVLKNFTRQVSCVFPMHPNTRKKFLQNGLWDELVNMEGIIVTEPLSYIDFMYLIWHAYFVVTDSGGIQEETTYLGIPCVTLRQNTERPITVLEGTNELSNIENLPAHINKILSGNWKKGKIPLLWDGNTSTRILQTLVDYERRL